MNCERETNLLYDYAKKRMLIYTTEVGVVTRVTKRLLNTEYKPVWTGNRQDGWRTEISFDAVRHPSLIVRLLDPDRDRGTFYRAENQPSVL